MPRCHFVVRFLFARFFSSLSPSNNIYKAFPAFCCREFCILHMHCSLDRVVFLYAAGTAPLNSASERLYLDCWEFRISDEEIIGQSRFFCALCTDKVRSKWSKPKQGCYTTTGILFHRERKSKGNRFFFFPSDQVIGLSVPIRCTWELYPMEFTQTHTFTVLGNFFLFAAEVIYWKHKY